VIRRLWRAKLKIVAGIVALLLTGFTTIQFVPYGHDHNNPSARIEPVWDSPQTRELVVRACYDCHSNETERPWYSNIAPISWIVLDHVEVGRHRLNFSEWDLHQRKADRAVRTINRGSMPPGYFTLLHGDAEFSDVEREELVTGLRATLKANGYPDERR
jgi:hypothetical protein